MGSEMCIRDRFDGSHERTFDVELCEDDIQNHQECEKSSCPLDEIDFVVFLLERKGLLFNENVVLYFGVSIDGTSSCYLFSPILKK